MSEMKGRPRRFGTYLAILLFVLCSLPLAAPARGRDDWQQPDRVMEDLNLQQGSRVADVGCGRGYFTFRLARAVGKAGKVLAVDVSKSAVRSVRKKAEQKDLSWIKPIRSKPEDAMLPAESLDAALLCLVLHHADENVRQKLMNSIAEAITGKGIEGRVNGREVKVARLLDYEGLGSRGSTVKLARRAGLELDAEFHYLEHQYFLRFRKPPEQEGAR